MLDKPGQFKLGQIAVYTSRVSQGFFENDLKLSNGDHGQIVGACGFEIIFEAHFANLENAESDRVRFHVSPWHLSPLEGNPPVIGNQPALVALMNTACLVMDFLGYDDYAICLHAHQSGKRDVVLAALDCLSQAKSKIQIEFNKAQAILEDVPTMLSAEEWRKTSYYGYIAKDLGEYYKKMTAIADMITRLAKFLNEECKP